MSILVRVHVVSTRSWAALETTTVYGNFSLTSCVSVTEPVPQVQGLTRNLTAIMLAVVGLTLFIATVIGVQSTNGLAGADRSAQQWMLTWRSQPLTTVMIVLAVIFGPIAMPIIILVVTVTWSILAKHAWRPMLLAGAMVTGMVLTQIIIRIVQRPRPPVDLMLFGVDHTYSYPSGHVLGASNFFLVIIFLVFSRRRHPVGAGASCVLAVIIIFVAAISRIYLGYHWVSDAIASVSLSLVILSAVIAVDTWRTVRIPGEEITGELSKAAPSEDVSQRPERT